MDFENMFNPEDGESIEDVIKRLLDMLNNLDKDEISDLDAYLTDALTTFNTDEMLTPFININDMVIAMNLDSSIEDNITFPEPKTIDELKSELDKLIDDELYEEAAVIRDKIKKIDG